MKKLALLLALVMVFGACSAFAEIEPLNLHELPLTEEPVTYTWWVNTSAKDLNENEIYGYLGEITGVNIDWTLVATDAETKRNLMWGSGDLPDIIGQGMFTESDLTTYYQYGVLLKISDYIDTCMPNLKWVVSHEGFETVLDSLKQADGNIYSLPKIESDNHTQVTSQVSINQTWLNNLGLEMPTTTDELYDVLVAFKEQDPNGNGEQDEIPFTYLYGQNWMNGQLNGWFGVTTDFRIDLDGKVTYSPYEDGYKEMVKYIRRLWQDGLMDPEFFTQDYSTYNAKGFEGRYGVFQSYGRYISVKEEDFVNYAYLAPLASGTEVSGSVRFRPDGATLELVNTIISADVENPELLLSYMDMLYDPYYGIQGARGVIGKHLIYNENGNLVNNLEGVPAGYSTFEEWRNATIAHQIPYCTMEEYIPDLIGTNAELVNYKEQSSFYRPWFINQILPWHYNTQEENDALPQYATDLEKYTTEQFARWVSGEGDVDAEWDAYKAQLEALHVKEYVAVEQGMVDRVLAQFAE
ncbi:MAG: hypothetical protein IJJ23_01925 [Clostridia bacterium]|nr:hypothetical protein [Clostridia bacterium]